MCQACGCLGGVTKESEFEFGSWVISKTSHEIRCAWVEGNCNLCRGWSTVVEVQGEIPYYDPDFPDDEEETYLQNLLRLPSTDE